MAYTYLAGSFIALALWFVLFWHRRDVRKEMLLLSSLVATMGLFLQGLVWMRDWFKPETVSGAPVGIEDLIYGFAVAGIAAVVYEEVFKVKASPRKKKKHATKDLILLVGLSLVILVPTFFILGWHSFPSTILAMLVPTAILLKRRPDLTFDSIASGAILTAFGFLGFVILKLVNPNFAQQYYFLGKISGVLVYGFPIENLVWYFAVGMFLGPIYEFWQNARLVKISSKNVGK